MEQTTTYETARDPGTAPATARDLTGRQRSLIAICVTLANDMDRNGTRDEQHTAAALRQLTDALERGYVGEMTALVRAWRLERERGEADGG